MIVDILILILKVVAVLFVILIARAVQKHLKIQSDIKRLTAQGIINYPGNEKFLFGPILDIMAQ